MNIYNITNDMLRIIDTIEENGGEVDDNLIEEFEFTQENLKEAVRDFTSTIHKEEDDINAIDKEINRLKSLKETKTKLITRLSDKLVKTIELFGTPNKSDVMTIDCQTVKVSIRRSKKVETDDNYIAPVVTELINKFNWYKESNQLDVANKIIPDEFIETLRNSKTFDENGAIEDRPIPVTADELKAINATISLSVPISELLEEKGYNLMKTLLHNYVGFKVVGSVNKTLIKKDNENKIYYPHIGYVANNKNLSIK